MFSCWGICPGDLKYIKNSLQADKNKKNCIVCWRIKDINSNLHTFISVFLFILNKRIYKFSSIFWKEKQCILCWHVEDADFDL